MASPGGRSHDRVSSARIEAQQIVTTDIEEIKRENEHREKNKLPIPESADEIEELIDEQVELILEMDEYCPITEPVRTAAVTGNQAA